MIRVLLAEDEATKATYLAELLSRAGMDVVSVAPDGKQAMKQIKNHSPDVLALDLDMPGTDGVDATARIMQTSALPIVVMTETSAGAAGAEKAFRAMNAGALAAVTKPDRSQPGQLQHLEREFTKTVRLMAEVKVVTRRGIHKQEKRTDAPAPKGPDVPVVAIGASTGGPPALQTILSGLPPDFPAALMIVQHITSGFLPGMEQWLNQTTGFGVEIATRDVMVRPGHAYLAPDGFHMGINPHGRIELSSDSPENGLRPAVSFLFRSVSRTYGARACGVLLTGMGTDGAWELREMRRNGGTTIVQNKDSSAIYGMPGRAVELDAALHILSPEQIARSLPRIISRIKQTQAEKNDAT